MDSIWMFLHVVQGGEYGRTLGAAARHLRGLVRATATPASQDRPIESATRNPTSRTGSRPEWRGGRRVHRRPTSLQQDLSTIDHIDEGPWHRRRCALRTISAAPIPSAAQSKGAQPPAGPPHPERTIRCAPDFRIRNAPGRSRREHRYGRARSRMPAPGARCSSLALQRLSNLPASARPASSSIASSPD